MIELRMGDQLVTVMNGSEPVNGQGSYPNFDIDYVYIISASVLDFSMNSTSRRAEMQSMMKQLGIENPPEIITTWANGGDRSQDYIDKLPDALSDAEGKQNVLFLFHGFGNDITDRGPWPGGISEFRNRVEQLIKMVHEAGHKAIWASVTYRTPNGSNPSAPYNVEMLHPLLEKISPESVSGSDFVYDLYGATVKHPEWISSDGIHPAARGRQLIRFETVKTLDRIMNGFQQPSPRSDYYGRKFIFNFGYQEQFENRMNGSLKGADTGNGPASTDGVSLTARMYDTEGVPVVGPYMRALYSDVNRAGANTDNSEVGILNGNLVSQSFFVNKQTHGSITVHDLPNGLTGTMKISSARETSEVRNGNFTYRGDTKVVDGGHSSGEEVNTASWDFTIEDGYLRIDFDTSDDSEYAYVNGWEIEFDSNPLRRIDNDEYSVQGFGTVLEEGSSGASFDLLDMSKMFQDVEGQIPVTNFGDSVRRIESNTPGIYLVDNGNPAVVTTYNGKPAIRLSSNKFRLQGLSPRYARPVVAHGTVDVTSENSIVYWYTRAAGAYAGRKWGAFVREGQYRLFRNNGIIDPINNPEWRSYKDVYLNRVGNYVMIDQEMHDYNSNDETYSDSDLGFCLGGYPYNNTDSLTGIVTYFIISDSELNEDSLQSIVNHHREYLDIS